MQTANNVTCYCYKIADHQLFRWNYRQREFQTPSNSKQLQLGKEKDRSKKKQRKKGISITSNLIDSTTKRCTSMAANTSESSPPHGENNKTWTETEIKTLQISHTWKIRNFSSWSKKPGERLFSEKFSSEEENSDKWYLGLYPNGQTEKHKDHLSLFLHLASSKKVSILATVKFSIHNAKMEKYLTKHFVQTFDKKNGSGLPQFMQRDVLLKKAKELLPNDTLTLSCKIILTEKIVNVSGKTIVTPRSQHRSIGLFQNLGHILDAGTLSDVTLFAGQREFQAHKLILSAHSSVFYAMFEHKMLDQQQNRVDIVDLDADVVEKMLRFIYTGQVENIEETAESLLVAADKYGIESLKSICQEQLNKNLSIENASQILMLADLHHVDWLKKQAINFINMNKNRVIHTESFNSTAISHPHLIVEVFVDSAMQKSDNTDKDEEPMRKKKCT